MEAAAWTRGGWGVGVGLGVGVGVRLALGVGDVAAGGGGAAGVGPDSLLTAHAVISAATTTMLSTTTSSLALTWAPRLSEAASVGGGSTQSPGSEPVRDHGRRALRQTAR